MSAVEQETVRNTGNAQCAVDAHDKRDCLQIFVTNGKDGSRSATISHQDRLSKRSAGKIKQFLAKIRQFREQVQVARVFCHLHPPL